MAFCITVCISASDLEGRKFGLQRSAASDLILVICSSIVCWREHNSTCIVCHCFEQYTDNLLQSQYVIMGPNKSLDRADYSKTHECTINTQYIPPCIWWRRPRVSLPALELPPASLPVSPCPLPDPRCDPT